MDQQITPCQWSELDWKVSPRKPLIKPKAAPHLAHQCTLTPPSSVHTLTLPVCATNEDTPSSRTFSNRSSKVSVDMPNLESIEVAGSPIPVFSCVGGHHRKSSSLIPINRKGNVGSLRRMGVPMTAETYKGLGLCGTLGRSTEPDVDLEDPDSDIPDELHVILSGQPDDDMMRPLDNTLSFRASPSPTLRVAPSVEDVPQSFSNLGDTLSMFGSDETGKHDLGLSQDQEQDISFSMRELEDECRVYPELVRQASMQSKPSDGYLNRNYKFGGMSSPQSSSNDSDSRPLTLSDIIPPSRTPGHTRRCPRRRAAQP